MDLIHVRAVVTGAGGGIGGAIVTELVRGGAQVLLVGRDLRGLEALSELLAPYRGHMDLFCADLARAADRDKLAAYVADWRGGPNVLINNAGQSPFGLYDAMESATLDDLLAVNLHAPMHLSHALLPALRRNAPASIVNVGSVFGAIGYPGYAAYCATKFGLRGFSEALRRELDGSGVAVQYLAPRATRTAGNSPAVERMNRELGTATDSPDRVAKALVSMLVSRKSSAVVGWPEKLFARINAVLPTLVDRTLRGQLPVIRRHASTQEAGGLRSTDEPFIPIRRRAS